LYFSVTSGTTAYWPSKKRWLSSFFGGLLLVYTIPSISFAQTMSTESVSRLFLAELSVESIENSLYRKTYTEQPARERLSRIERSLFGAEWVAKNEDRLKRIRAKMMEGPSSAKQTDSLRSLAYLERKMFALSYENDPIDLRLSRLEDSVFNAVFPTLPVEKRLEQLMYTIPLNSSEVRLVRPSGQVTNTTRRPVTRSYQSDQTVTNEEIPLPSGSLDAHSDRAPSIKPSSASEDSRSNATFPETAETSSSPFYTPSDDLSSGDTVQPFGKPKEYNVSIGPLQNKTVILGTESQRDIETRLKSNQVGQSSKYYPVPMLTIPLFRKKPTPPSEFTESTSPERLDSKPLANTTVSPTTQPAEFIPRPPAPRISKLSAFPSTTMERTTVEQVPQEITSPETVSPEIQPWWKN
jgi:hypothetical protein